MRLSAVLFLAAIFLAAQQAAARDVTPLPTAVEAIAAYYEYEIEVCRELRATCEATLRPFEPGLVDDLRCRAGRAGHARCRFSVMRRRCTVDFVNPAAGPDFARSVQWSRLAESEDPVWVIAWTASPEPNGPRVRCRLPD